MREGFFFKTLASLEVEKPQHEIVTALILFQVGEAGFRILAQAVVKGKACALFRPFRGRPDLGQVFNDKAGEACFFSESGGEQLVLQRFGARNKDLS